MPIAPPPIKTTCTQCGWSTVTKNTSDVIVVKPPSVCGGCGGVALRQEKAGLFDTLFSKILPP